MTIIPKERTSQELKTHDRWVGWRYERVRRGLTKVPYSLDDGRPASTTDPSTWASYERCAGHERVGFVFAEADPYAGVDLDDCLDPETGEISSPTARAVVRHLKSYTEVSPSGRGLKAVVRGEVPGPRRQNKRLGIEMYDTGRFFALTGRKLAGYPTTVVEADLGPVYRWAFGAPPDTPGDPEPTGARRPADRRLSDEEVLERAASASNGAKFSRLWRGDASGYPSRSEADLALCAILAYWCGPDPEKIEALFARSGLSRRKWHARPDYRRCTISLAIASAPCAADVPGRRGRRRRRRRRRRPCTLAVLEQQETPARREGAVRGSADSAEGR